MLIACEGGCSCWGIDQPSVSDEDFRSVDFDIGFPLPAPAFPDGNQYLADIGGVQGCARQWRAGGRLLLPL